MDAQNTAAANEWSELILRVGKIAREATPEVLARESDRLVDFFPQFKRCGDHYLAFLKARQEWSVLNIPQFTGFTAADIEGRLGMLEHYEDLMTGPKNTPQQTAEMDAILASL